MDRPAGVWNCRLSAEAVPAQEYALLFSQSWLQHAANSNACSESPHSQRPCRQMLNLPHKKSEDRTAAVTVQNQYVQNCTEPCQSSGCRGMSAAAKHVDFGNEHACLVMEREGLLELKTGKRWLCRAALPLSSIVLGRGQVLLVGGTW